MGTACLCGACILRATGAVKKRFALPVALAAQLAPPSVVGEYTVVPSFPSPLEWHWHLGELLAPRARVGAGTLTAGSLLAAGSGTVKYQGQELPRPADGRALLSAGHHHPSGGHPLATALLRVGPDALCQPQLPAQALGMPGCGFPAAPHCPQLQHPCSLSAWAFARPLLSGSHISPSNPCPC